MAHDVKLCLWRSATPFSIPPSVTTVDTTATAYDLEALDLVTPVGDPLTEHVVETMRVRITGTSKADLRTKLSAVYDFADQVRRFWADGNVLFGGVLMQVENTGNSYWSLLYNVQVSHDDILGATLANYQTVVTITYERDGFWEWFSTSPVQLTLTNPNGTGTTPLNIANCNDGTGISPNILANYVDIDTTSVDGDVPTPAYVNLRNEENVAAGDSRIYIGGVAAVGSSTLPTLFLEGETATGGTNTADATCSAGYKERISLASGAEAEMLSWALTTNVDRYLAYWYKVIARWAVATNLDSVTFRWKIASGSTIVWEGPQFKLNDPTTLIQEMGEVPLPPLLNWGGSLNLKLFGKQTTGGALTLDLDYIQLMAVNCVVKTTFMVPVEYQQCARVPSREDFINHKNPARYASGYYYDCYSELNRCIMLNPGLYTRLHVVIQSETAGTAEKDRNSIIEFAYRPRYRSIGE